MGCRGRNARKIFRRLGSWWADGNRTAKTCERSCNHTSENLDWRERQLKRVEEDAFPFLILVGRDYTEINITGWQSGLLTDFLEKSKHQEEVWLELLFHQPTISVYPGKECMSVTQGPSLALGLVKEGHLEKWIYFTIENLERFLNSYKLRNGDTLVWVKGTIASQLLGVLQTTHKSISRAGHL